MKILIAGAAGFVGSHLTARLLADGHHVIGVDNFITGRRANLAEVGAHPRFRFIEHDVAEPLPPGLPVDWVLHFASPASPPRFLAAPIATLRANAEGARHLLDLARRHGAQFLLASTSEVYGDPEQHPQPESYHGNVNPIGPRAVYDEAKRYAEALTLAYHQSHAVSVRIIRIFNTYGPHMDPDDGRVVTALIGQALRGEPLTILGDGTQTRSFQYIDDLVAGVVRLMAVPYHLPVNLGNPHEVRVIELAEMVRELTGSRSPLVFGPPREDDPHRRRPDISLARRILGWEPLVPLREGLARTIAAMRAAP